MEEKIPDGYYRDTMNRLVPAHLVSEIDKERDALVKEIVTNAEVLSNALTEFKQRSMDDIRAFVELSAEKYGIKKGGVKGNLSLHTYDGEYMVMVAISDSLHYDERMHAAKELIDQCLNDWNSSSCAELRVIVNDVFTVNKKGCLDLKRILSLRRYKFDDKRWQDAMQAITDSLLVIGSKAYLRIYKRTADKNYQMIGLDISAV